MLTDPVPGGARGGDLPVQSFTYRHSASRGRSGNKVSRHHDMAPLLSRRRHDLGAVSRRVGGRLPNVCLQAHSGCSRLVACRRCSDRGGGRRHRVRGAGGRPRKSSRQQPIQFGLRARAVALRMPMAGTAGEADLHSWSAAGLKHRLEKRCPFSYLISVLVWWNVPSGPALSCVSLMGFLEWAAASG